MANLLLVVMVIIHISNILVTIMANLVVVVE
jgi:hypothetical protein